MGVATILVTHDQEEAFDLADRIGVMSYGRLVEVGRPADLYQRPESEFVASFLGAANLLVGLRDSQGTRLGPVRLNGLDHGLANGAPEPDISFKEQRVQLLIRPEDVTVAPSKEELDSPALGSAEVESAAFGGSLERLRLRLPPIPGVRTIAPAVHYGAKNIHIEAARQPDAARRFPLSPGDRVWVGVRRFHTLEHPGMSFLVVAGEEGMSEAALQFGGQLARLAHARVTLLGAGDLPVSASDELAEARKQLGNGLDSVQTLYFPGRPIAAAVAEAVERQPHDLVILGFRPGDDPELARQILHTGEHHLLLVPAPQPVPASALICVTAGEPGKDDVLFAGRLARHLGTDATLLSVARPGPANGWLQEQTHRFLEGGVQSLVNLGVNARTLIREGNPPEVIARETIEGGYGMLVLGAPLADLSGEISLGGVVGHILKTVTDRAILIVRSNYVAARPSIKYKQVRN
jgi:hypothetical protein